MKQKAFGIGASITAAVLMIVLIVELIAPNLLGASTQDKNTVDGVYDRGDFIGLTDIDEDYYVYNQTDAAITAMALFESNVSGWSEKETINYEGDTLYRLQPMCEGYPLWGHHTTLMTDSDGRVYSASSDCAYPKTVITEEKVSAEDVTTLAKEYAINKLSADENVEITAYVNSNEPLVVYMPENSDKGQLCHQIEVSFLHTEGIPQSYTLLVSTLDGTVENAQSHYYGIQGPVRGEGSESGDFLKYSSKPEQVTAEIEGNTVLLRDAGRNIDIYNAEGDPAYKRTYDNTLAPVYYSFGSHNSAYTEWNLEIEEIDNDGSMLSSGGLEVLHTAEGIYDYYSEYCQRTGPDGYGGNLSIVYNCRYIPGENKPFGKDEQSAFSFAGDKGYPYGSIFTFRDFDVSSYEDLGHEYTHLIQSPFAIWDTNWENSDQTKALAEGYADIFGILSGVYAKDEEPTWKDNFRDLNPDNIGKDGKIGIDTYFSDVQYYNYEKYMADKKHKPVKEGDKYTGGYAYEGCTIPGRAMALTWERWRWSQLKETVEDPLNSSNSEMSREKALRNMSSMLWRSLFYLPNHPTLPDFAWAVTAAANDIGLSDEEKHALRLSLEDVGLPVSDSNTLEPIDFSELDAPQSEVILEACAAVIKSDETHLTADNEEYLARQLLDDAYGYVTAENIRSSLSYKADSICWTDATREDLEEYFRLMFGNDCLIDMDALHYFQFNAGNCVISARDELAIRSGWSIEITSINQNEYSLNVTGSVFTPSQQEYVFGARFDRQTTNRTGVGFFYDYTLEALTVSSLNGICMGTVYDAETGEPVAGAKVAINPHINDNGELNIAEFIDNVYAQTTTKEDGSYQFEESQRAGTYDVVVRCEGYQDKWSTVSVIREEPREGVLCYLLEEIPIHKIPDEKPKADFDDLLSTLADQYGVIPLGSDPYTQVPDERLKGLLGADIYDYDGDGENELLTFRIDPYPQGASAGYAHSDTMFFSVYESDGGTAPASEVEIPFQAWTDDFVESSAIHLFRYERNGYPYIGIDYFCEMNSVTFGVLEGHYGKDGLFLSGSECDEFEGGAYVLYSGNDNDPCKDFVHLIRLPSSNWITDYSCNWESDYSQQESYIPQYLKYYLDKLKKDRGLTDRNLRSAYGNNTEHAPNVTVNEFYGANDPELFEDCHMKPSEHYDNVQDLCGIAVPRINVMDSSYTVQLTTYDETDLLAPYR